MIGSTIAHYRITAKLGEGGMGVVYRATDDRLHRDVAIKLLPEAVDSDPARLARFQREAQVLDVGLAKALGHDTAEQDVSSSPTMTAVNGDIPLFPRRKSGMSPF